MADHDSAPGTVRAAIDTKAQRIRTAAHQRTACMHRRDSRYICATCANRGLWCPDCFVHHELTHPLATNCSYCPDTQQQPKPLLLRLDSGVWIVGHLACDRCLIDATLHGRRLSAA